MERLNQLNPAGCRLTEQQEEEQAHSTTQQEWVWSTVGERTSLSSNWTLETTGEHHDFNCFKLNFRFRLNLGGFWFMVQSSNHFSKKWQQQNLNCMRLAVHALCSLCKFKAFFRCFSASIELQIKCILVICSSTTYKRVNLQFFHHSFLFLCSLKINENDILFVFILLRCFVDCVSLNIYPDK